MYHTSSVRKAACWTQGMLLGEGFNKYVLCGKYCRYCILFTIVGFEGRRWIGRGVKGSARFVDQMMSFSPLCPSREVKGFALRWNLLHIKLYSFYREHCCCLCPSLSFALPFTFKSNSVNCSWAFSACSYFRMIVFCSQMECRLACKEQNKDISMEEAEDTTLMATKRGNILSDFELVCSCGSCLFNCTSSSSCNLLQFFITAKKGKL